MQKFHGPWRKTDLGDENRIERWRKTRSRGPLFFIGVFGALWGVFMFAVMCIAQFLMMTFMPERTEGEFFLPLNLAIYFLVFLVVGFLWAGVNWYMGEKRLKEYEKGQDG